MYPKRVFNSVQVIILAGLLTGNIGCGNGAKDAEAKAGTENETEDFAGKLFDAKLPDTSAVFRQNPDDLTIMTFQYAFNKDTTGEMRIRKGAQINQVPFVWRVEKDSIQMKFNNVDGRLFIKRQPTGFELLNRQFRVTLTPSE